MQTQTINDTFLIATANDAHGGDPVTGTVREVLDNFVNHGASEIEVSILGGKVYSWGGEHASALCVRGNSNCTAFVTANIGATDSDNIFHSVGRGQDYSSVSNSVHNTGNMISAFCFGPAVTQFTVMVDVAKQAGVVILYTVPKETRTSNTTQRHSTIGHAFCFCHDAGTESARQGLEVELMVSDPNDADNESTQLENFNLLVRQSPFHDSARNFRDSKAAVRGFIKECITRAVAAHRLDSSKTHEVAHLYVAPCIGESVTYNDAGDDIVYTDGAYKTSMRDEAHAYFTVPDCPNKRMCDKDCAGVDGVQMRIICHERNTVHDTMSRGDTDWSGSKSTNFDRLLQVFKDQHATNGVRSIQVMLQATPEDFESRAGRKYTEENLGSLPGRKKKQLLAEGYCMPIFIDIATTPCVNNRVGAAIADAWVSGFVDISNGRTMDASTAETRRAFDPTHWIPNDRSLSERKYSDSSITSQFVHPFLQNVVMPCTGTTTWKEMEDKVVEVVGHHPRVYFMALLASIGMPPGKETFDHIGNNPRALLRMLGNGHGVCMVCNFDNFMPALSKKTLHGSHTGKRSDDINRLKAYATFLAIPDLFNGQHRKRMQYIEGKTAMWLATNISYTYSANSTTSNSSQARKAPAHPQSPRGEAPQLLGKHPVKGLVAQDAGNAGKTTHTLTRSHESASMPTANSRWQEVARQRADSCKDVMKATFGMLASSEGYEGVTLVKGGILQREAQRLEKESSGFSEMACYVNNSSRRAAKNHSGLAIVQLANAAQRCGSALAVPDLLALVQLLKVSNSQAIGLSPHAFKTGNAGDFSDSPESAGPSRPRPCDSADPVAKRFKATVAAEDSCDRQNRYDYNSEACSSRFFSAAAFVAQGRVAALKRLWERAEPSPSRRLFRHEFYARIAVCEKDVWALCSTEDQRAMAVMNPKEPGKPKPDTAIVRAWDVALRNAFGLEFKNVRGSHNQSSSPNGFWTDELNLKIEQPTIEEGELQDVLAVEEVEEVVEVVEVVELDADEVQEIGEKEEPLFKSAQAAVTAAVAAAAAAEEAATNACAPTPAAWPYATPLSEEAKTAVIAELKAKIKEATADDQVVPHRDIIVKLTDESLLLLAQGSRDVLNNAKKLNSPRMHYSVLENNLALCVQEAFPSCDAVKNDVQKSWMGRKFSGWGFTKIVLLPSGGIEKGGVQDV